MSGRLILATYMALRQRQPTRSARKAEPKSCVTELFRVTRL